MIGFVLILTGIRRCISVCFLSKNGEYCCTSLENENINVVLIEKSLAVLFAIALFWTLIKYMWRFLSMRRIL